LNKTRLISIVDDDGVVGQAIESFVTSLGFFGSHVPVGKGIHAIVREGGNIVPDFPCLNAGYWWDPDTSSPG
jgi:hypothetical protein